ncbi:MAG: VOC family protein [Pseudomonadota bacterium]
MSSDTDKAPKEKAPEETAPQEKTRPPVWIGHVALKTPDLDASANFMETVGLRPIFRGDEVVVLELRGGTHLILQPGEAGSAEFDFMVEDLDASHTAMAGSGYTVSEIERGRIHDTFRVTEPGGNVIRVNSTHVPDHDAV